MKITAIPREDKNSVSTRIHYYAYLNNLPEGYRWKPHTKEFADLLYVQKKADDKTIKIVKKAKKAGVPVVYDCDDNPYHKPGKDRVKMLTLADVVTTDTETRGKQLRKAAKIRSLFVIPECLDYYDKLRKVPLNNNILITFGNNSNAVNTAKYMQYVNMKCRHINSKKIAGAGKFIKWKYDTFIEEMSKAEICILIHGDNLKSNLKLLVCMAIGIPTIVSDTTNYKETYRKIGLEWLVAKNPTCVPGIINRIRTHRDIILKAYSKYDMEQHTPKAAGRNLAGVFEYAQF